MVPDHSRRFVRFSLHHRFQKPRRNLFLFSYLPRTPLAQIDHPHSIKLSSLALDLLPTISQTRNSFRHLPFLPLLVHSDRTRTDDILFFGLEYGSKRSRSPLILDPLSRSPHPPSSSRTLLPPFFRQLRLTRRNRFEVVT